MPVVAASITAREWDEVEQEHSIRHKTIRKLASEGQWVLEGIESEGFDVVHKVPALKRFVLVHGFARAYRRQFRTQWAPDFPRQQRADP